MDVYSPSHLVIIGFDPSPDKCRARVPILNYSYTWRLSKKHFWPWFLFRQLSPPFHRHWQPHSDTRKGLFKSYTRLMTWMSWGTPKFRKPPWMKINVGTAWDWGFFNHLCGPSCAILRLGKNWIQDWHDDMRRQMPSFATWRIILLLVSDDKPS